MVINKIEIVKAVSDLLSDPNYPCIPAIKAFKNNQLLIRETNDLMSGSVDITEYLCELKDRYRSGKEQYLSLWLMFDDTPMSEETFENCLFKVLKPFNINGEFIFNGSRLFVVGMHPNASRLARRFRYNSIVINLFEQFETLKDYPKLVETIRERDIKYSGSVNAMCLEHGDGFEEIQFSGKMNPKDWKIPE